MRKVRGLCDGRAGCWTGWRHPVRGSNSSLSGRVTRRSERGKSASLPLHSRLRWLDWLVRARQVLLNYVFVLSGLSDLSRHSPARPTTSVGSHQSAEQTRWAGLRRARTASQGLEDVRNPGRRRACLSADSPGQLARRSCRPPLHAASPATAAGPPCLLLRPLNAIMLLLLTASAT